MLLPHFVGIKKTIVTGIPTAMIVGGLYLLGVELFWADAIEIKFVIAGAVTAALGGYLALDRLTTI